MSHAAVHADRDVSECSAEAELGRGGADTGQISHQDLEETAGYCIPIHSHNLKRGCFTYFRVNDSD